MKTPYVKVTAQFYLKDASKEHLGLRHESWNFGIEPIPLHQLLGGIAYRLLRFYMTVLPTPADEINAELEKFRQALASIEVVENLQDGSQ